MNFYLQDEEAIFKSITQHLKIKSIDKFDEKIDELFEDLMNQFKFDIEFNKKTNFSGHTKYRDILANIVAIYKNRFEFLNENIFQKISLVLPVSLFVMIYSSIKYHNKYIRFDFYENNVMGVKFYELDEKRRCSGYQNILPLEPVLKEKYVGLFELRMTSNEKAYTIKSLTRLLIALIPLLLILWIDVKLASINNYLAKNTVFDFEWDNRGNREIRMNKGGGFVANVFKEMFESTSTRSNSKRVNNFKCLPQTNRISHEVHYTIGVNIVLLLVLVCLQAYIKRIRALICGCVYPDRDQERAVWLYNHLMNLYSRYANI